MGVNGDGTNFGAGFTALEGVARDGAGNLYVVDSNAIRKIAPSGTNWIVTTIAGFYLSHGAGNDGTIVNARFNNPQGAAVDAAGNVYVADCYDNSIRKVAPIGTNWVVTTIAGATSMSYGSNDGTNNAARFHNPYGIAADSSGALYVADMLNHTIRKVAPMGTNWVVTTLAGFPGASGTVDGIGTNAHFKSPFGIAVDNNGVLYIADLAANTIRKITPVGADWVVTTLAGTDGVAGSTDGMGAAARFNLPQGIAVDAAHNLFVADSDNQTIRRITPAGNVTTIAGLAGVKGSANGIGSAVRFDAPYWVAADSAGKLYVTEYGGDGSGGGYTVRQGQVAPFLQIAKVNNQVVLSWAEELTGFVPQVCYSLPSPSWHTLLDIPSVSDGSWVVTNAMQPGPNFYRLFK